MSEDEEHYTARDYVERGYFPWFDFTDVPEHLRHIAVDRAMTEELGMTVRLHVQMDVRLRVLLAALLKQPGFEGLPLTTTPLIDACRKELSKATALQQYAKDCERVFESANTANANRNRVLHDEWVLSETDSEENLKRLQTTKAGELITVPVKLEDMQAIAMHLGAVSYRLLGILILLKWSEIDSREYCKETDEMRSNALALMNKPTFRWPKADREATGRGSEDRPSNC